MPICWSVGPEWKWIECLSHCTAPGVPTAGRSTWRGRCCRRVWVVPDCRPAGLSPVSQWPLVSGLLLLLKNVSPGLTDLEAGETQSDVTRSQFSPHGWAGRQTPWRPGPWF